MWPDSPFAVSAGSFPNAVIPPDVDPGDSPTRSVSVNCQWLPYIRGALQQLVLQSTWKVDTADELLLAQQRAMTLITMFDECDTLVIPFACRGDAIHSASPFQTWTSGFNGVWTSGVGYLGTTAFGGGGDYYHGLWVNIFFDNPIRVSNIILHYNLTCGQWDTTIDPSCIHVLDGEHFVTIGTPVLSGDCASTDFGEYATGAYATPFNQLWILINSGRATIPPFPPGSCALTEVIISGYAAVPPC